MKTAPEGNSGLVPAQIYREATLTPGGDGREFTFIASDESADSYGDIVRVAGWDLKRYKNNPIVLFGHDTRQPIGTAKMTLDKEKLQLLATVKLAAEGTSEFIDSLAKLMQQKIVKAVSVGFRPLSYEILRDKDGDYRGIEFLTQELLELSVCSVPANPNSLSTVKSISSRESVHSRLFAFDAVVKNAHTARKRALQLYRLGATS